MSPNVDGVINAGLNSCVFVIEKKDSRSANAGCGHESVEKAVHYAGFAG